MDSSSFVFRDSNNNNPSLNNAYLPEEGEGEEGYPVLIPGFNPNEMSVRVGRFEREAQTETRNLFGNYKSYCKGFIVLGPKSKIILLNSFFFILAILVFIFQLKEVKKLWGGLDLWILGLILHIIGFILYLVICLRDPGVIPTYYTLRELVKDTYGYRTRNPGKRFYRFCSKCEGFRPPKCYHCDVCNICIRGQEFHMSGGGTCIGQRNVRSYTLMSLILGVLAWYLLIINSMIISKMQEPFPIMPTIISLLVGTILALMPQLGILVFLFKLYQIAVGQSSRIFLDVNRPEEEDCSKDNQSVCKNLWGFLIGSRKGSAFKRRREQIQPENCYISGSGRRGSRFLHDPNWFNDNNIPSLSSAVDSRMLIQNQISPDSNNNDTRLTLEELEEEASGRGSDSAYRSRSRSMQGRAERIRRFEEEDEAFLLRDLVARAKYPQNPSVEAILDYSNQAQRQTQNQRQTQLQTEERTKIPLPFKKSKPSVLLEKKIAQFRAAGAGLSSGGTIGAEFLGDYPITRPNPTRTLSDGAIIPHSFLSIPNQTALMQTARAEQFSRLVQLILIRDTFGINEMARATNLAGLFGVRYFNPNNLEIVELWNGVPMVALRNMGEMNQLSYFNNGGYGYLGIAHLVAAGMIPTATRLVSNLERQLGLPQGSVIRENHSVIDGYGRNTMSMRLRLPMDASIGCGGGGGSSRLPVGVGVGLVKAGGGSNIGVGTNLASTRPNLSSLLRINEEIDLGALSAVRARRRNRIGALRSIRQGMEPEVLQGIREQNQNSRPSHRPLLQPHLNPGRLPHPRQEQETIETSPSQEEQQEREI